MGAFATAKELAHDRHVAHYMQEDTLLADALQLIEALVVVLLEGDAVHVRDGGVPYGAHGRADAT